MCEKTIREEKLAEEILETQKTRSSLLQWKLLLCAALGSAGLGLANAAGDAKIGLLALIPLACAYVDLLCTNLNLRIILIGRYFADERKDPYEVHARNAAEQRQWFVLEDRALYWSTYIVSIILAGFAIARIFILYAPQSQPSWCESCQPIAVLIACVIGPFLTWTTQKEANKRIRG